MNYDTFFNLGLDLDDKAVPHVRTASGTDMRAIVFTTLTFAINKHVFTQQFIICRSQMRPLILGQDFCVCLCTGCTWTPHGTKRFMVNQKLVLEIEEPEADQFFRVKKSVNIPQGTMLLLTFNVEIRKKQLPLDLMRHSKEQIPQCGHLLCRFV